MPTPQTDNQQPTPTTETPARTQVTRLVDYELHATVGTPAQEIDASQFTSFDAVEKWMKSTQRTNEGEGLRFPPLSGSLWDYAQYASEGTEVPLEFHFASALPIMGHIACDRVRTDLGPKRIRPQLYTLLLAPPGMAKKSTAIRDAQELFTRVRELVPAIDSVHSIGGAGSAEGIVNSFSDNHDLLIVSDEFSALMKKGDITASVLPELLTNLYEGTSYSSPTKEHEYRVENGHLSVLAATTTEKWSEMSGGVAIGLPSRLFIVRVDAGRPRVAFPPPKELGPFAERIGKQLARLPAFGASPLILPLTSDAKLHWQSWYNGRPSDVHAERLDGLGFRMMPLLALSMDKAEIDAEVINAAISLVTYEYEVRTGSAPNEALTLDAKQEQEVIAAVRRLRKPDLGPTVRDIDNSVKFNKKYGAKTTENVVLRLRYAEVLEMRTKGKREEYFISKESRA